MPNLLIDAEHDGLIIANAFNVSTFQCTVVRYGRDEGAGMAPGQLLTKNHLQKSLALLVRQNEVKSYLFRTTSG